MKKELLSKIASLVLNGFTGASDTGHKNYQHQLSNGRVSVGSWPVCVALEERERERERPGGERGQKRNCKKKQTNKQKRDFLSKYNDVSYIEPRDILRH